ncbi:hypothetical protein BHU72_13785 [Desulfuribacillus stibiiarsenatis]|uniref:Haloacid dehalogenase n=1 Tax=Desulfuribacillus stibiiarsenatis TaxID=1390249 RepID=A0A1E5L809_9FIRM|nr:HAD family hydrolase [Desulfuribacillus stibiiarsenatis]OEH86292.1 hypothetical protein BHU72_13785 [Desulfuribacillus stibiiarsenatis]
MIQHMIFDLDGTLFETERIAVPAFVDTFKKLRDEGLFDGEMPKEETFLRMFGLTLNDIWNKLLPSTDQQTKDIADRYMGQFEKDYIDKGNGKLYDGVLETLNELRSRGIQIFIASNGAKEYVDYVLEKMGIEQVITKAYSAGEYQTVSKVDLVAQLLKDNQLNPTDTWMIGDRSSDIEAGQKNHLRTVACAYGFADQTELAHANDFIHSFSELIPLLAKHNE